MCKISLIIPAYNVDKYIEDCLYSCINQEVSPRTYEIVVVNDGSTDKTESIINRFIKENPKYQIKIISQENRGLSVARNIGVKYSTGEFIWFIDSDDWIRQSCLSEIISILELHPSLDMLKFTATDVIGEKNIKRSITSCFDKGLITNGASLLNFNPIPVCATLYVVRKSLLIEKNIFFLQGVFHEDMEFSPRLYNMASKVYVINKSFYYIRQTPGSITRSINPKKSFDLFIIIRSLLQYMNKDKAKSIKGFYQIILLCLNSSFKNISYCTKKDQALLISSFKELNLSFRVFFSSQVMKYRIQGVFYSLLDKKIYAKLMIKYYNIKK